MADFELDSELQAYVEERLGHPFEESTVPNDPGSTEPDEDGELEESGEEDEGTSETPPEVPDEPSSSSIFEVAPGVAITRDQALSYYQFDAILKGRPELAQEITDLINGRPREAGDSQPATPASLEIPDEYRDDPVVKPMYDAYTAQNNQIAEMRQRLDELQNITVNRDQEEMRAIVDQSRIRFQQENGLNDTEMNAVFEAAGRLNVLPSLLNGIDPMTGQPQARDRASAINRAYEIAYWSMPEMRERALHNQVTKRAKNTQRKQRLAGVSGGGGGAVQQNTDPRNMTQMERRQAMISEIAGLTGNEEA